MILDAYSYCPGGTGKKIKHCECRDIAGELEKIVKAIEGEQRVAALDRINRTLATKAHRPCLLALKILTLLGMKDMQGLEDTVTTFVKVAPNNPLAHTFAAMLEARKRRVREAVDEIQAAVSSVTDTMPGELYDALGDVAQLLANSGEYLAARAHVLVRAVIGQHEEDSLRAITAISGAENIPLAFKYDRRLEPCPAGATWKGRFDAAYQHVRGGLWRKGLEKFEKLNEDFPGQPAILWNIALTRSYLAMPKTAEAWHAYAICPGADFDAAVDAESLAQLLTYEVDQPQVALVNWTVKVADATILNERLLSSKYLVAYAGDVSEFRQEDAPPPKSVFMLLDRPVLNADDELTPLNVPRVLATVRLYGRQTDRDARLETTVPKSETFDQMRRMLREVAGDQLTSDETEEIVEMIPRQQWDFHPHCHFPSGTTLAVRKRIIGEVVQQAVLETWPKIALAALDGKTPEQVAEDPAYRIHLEAALIALEQYADAQGWMFQVDRLRQRLGVPLPEPLDLSTENAENEALWVAPAHWARVVPEKLSDLDLARLFERAVGFKSQKAVWRLGQELLKRPGLADQVNRSAICMLLAELAEDMDESLALVLKAKQFARETNQSPARCLLSELSLRILRGDVAEAQQVITTLRTHHRQEPGIMEAVYDLLVRFGIIAPEGHRTDAMGETAHTQPAPPAASQLWTPDAPPAAAEGQQPSKLWVPD
ncbi:MAG: hypothetical protein ACYC4U_01065 [Pirellulaceae bacterium]